MTENLNIMLVFAAGLASVLSPCVLPVVPIIVTGSGEDHRLRPVMIVAGLALTFMVMGVLSSLFGFLIGPRMGYVEKAAGAMIALLGLLLVAGVNLFKYAGFLSRFAQKSRGRAGGFLLGLTLGIVWIPCVGPMLSGVLALVATHGRLWTGIGFLAVYSLGFAVPMLIAGYTSQFFRARVRGIGKHPHLVSVASGLALLALGIFIIAHGMVGFVF